MLSASNQSLTAVPEASHFPDTNPDQIRILDLSFNSISTFSGLGNFPQLEELILDNNTIASIELLDQYPNLKLLSLNNNRISELEQFLSAVERLLPNLNYLSCLGNPCCPDQLTDNDNTEDDYRRYRFYVIFRLPNLRFLDSRQITSKEKREAQRHGPFLRRVRITAHENEGVPPPSEENSNAALPFNPLPKSTGNAPESAAYRPCRYVYRGIHSEGNRFIRDNQL